MGSGIGSLRDGEVLDVLTTRANLYIIEESTNLDNSLASKLLDCARVWMCGTFASLENEYNLSSHLVTFLE